VDVRFFKFRYSIRHDRSRLLIILVRAKENPLNQFGKRSFRTHKDKSQTTTFATETSKLG